MFPQNDRNLCYPCDAHHDTADDNRDALGVENQHLVDRALLHRLRSDRVHLPIIRAIQVHAWAIRARGHVGSLDGGDDCVALRACQTVQIRAEAHHVPW